MELKIVLERMDDFKDQPNNKIPIEPPKRTYECNLCKRTYTQLQNLQRHMKSHTVGKVEKCFKCIKCDMEFNQIAHLWKHMSTVHIDDERIKNHVCDICGKVIVRHIHLHKLIHQGIKPFSCKICEKKFSTASNLSQHMWRHSEIQRFKCDSCDRTFNRIG